MPVFKPGAEEGRHQIVYLEGVAIDGFYAHKFEKVEQVDVKKVNEMQIGDIIILRNNNAGDLGGMILDNQVGLVFEIEHVREGYVSVISVADQPGFTNHYVWMVDNKNVIPFLRLNDKNHRYYYVDTGLQASVLTNREKVWARKNEVFRREKDNVQAVKKVVIQKPAEPPFDLEAKKKEVRKALHDTVTKSGQSVASYAIIGNNRLVRNHYRDICHARLRGGGLAAFDAIHGEYKKWTKEEQKKYHIFYNWLANESPWKDAFITKDCQEALDNCVEYNVDAGHNIMYSAAIALRGYSEFEKQREGWVQFNGESKLIWVASLLFLKMDDGQYLYSGTTNGHRTWGSTEPHIGIVSFLNKGFTNEPKKHSWKEGGKDTNCERTMREGHPKNGQSTDERIKEHPLLIQKKVGFGTRFYAKNAEDVMKIIQECFNV